MLSQIQQRRSFIKKLMMIAGGGMFTANRLHAVETSGEPTLKLDSIDAGTFVFWMLPSQTGGQMVSYVMQTVNGKVIVIDGGYAADADYLKGFLAALGNKVDMWFISHQHLDHFNALTAILNKPGDLQIENIYGSLLDIEDIKEHENPYIEDAINFNEAVEKAGKQVIELALGQVFEIDGITIKILGIKNPEITSNFINNSSVAMRVWDDHKSILFTGDLGVQGGQKLLASEYAQYLEADYVEMSHHGQAGVTREFYEAVNAKYAIWPTPLWLWDNDNGGGKNSGPWATLTVRAWMEELGIQKHYRMLDGLNRIE